MSCCWRDADDEEDEEDDGGCGCGCRDEDAVVQEEEEEGPETAEEPSGRAARESMTIIPVVYGGGDCCGSACSRSCSARMGPSATTRSWIL